jgi:hypothetical protein
MQNNACTELIGWFIGSIVSRLSRLLNVCLDSLLVGLGSIFVKESSCLR